MKKLIDLKIKRLTGSATLPSQAHPGDAGLDLYADEDTVLTEGEWKIVKTGIAISIPDGYAGLVLPRSGLAAKHGLTIMNSPGLIDPPYRGEVGVILTNLGKLSFNVERGARIAQLLVVRHEQITLVETDDLDKTDRGSGGFGSSGN